MENMNRPQGHTSHLTKYQRQLIEASQTPEYARLLQPPDSDILDNPLIDLIGLESLTILHN